MFYNVQKIKGSIEMTELDFNRLFSKNLNYYLNLKGSSQAELAKYLGVSATSVTNWCRGLKTPRMDKVDKMCSYFNINRSDLMSDKTEHTKSNRISANRIKVYRSVPAGIPLEAIEDVVDWEDIPLDWSVGGNEFIGLRVKGDSMAPKYVDGDTVIVKIQPDCESGQDVVVYVNGYEATLKKLIKKTDCLILQPLNPSYEPKVYDYNDEDNPINILGIVVELRRKI